MAIKAIDFKFTGATTRISAYDQNKTNLGNNINQYTGLNVQDKFAGPSILGLGRPMEASTAIPVMYPHVITVNSTIDWVFLADNATAAATRRIVLYEYNKLTSVFTWMGFITLTYPVATNHTIRGFRIARNLYTTGTAEVTGTAVTGSGTAWSTSKLSVGTRIGFGNTDPSLITTWYQITAIGSDSSITIDSSVTVPASTPYVIDDMMVVTTTTNATAANGGLFVAKGIRPEIFTNGGTTIPAATTVDNIRAVYWLADASVVTNTTGAGTAIETMSSWTQQNCYVLNVTGARIFKYNLRASLTLTAGKDTTSLLLQTGNQVLAGTLSQTNNGRVANTAHGPGAGADSLYYVTTTRVYRSLLTNITAASTTFVNDVMLEIPPGGVNTYAATSALSSIEYSGVIDRFLVMTSGAAGIRSYCTKYNTTSDPFDHIFLIDDKQIDATVSDSGGVIHPAILALPFTVWSEGGILYLVRSGTTSLNNHIYSLPLLTHQTYAFANNEFLITPKFDISNANKLYTVSIRSLSKLGTDTFSLPTEAYKVYYRTSGIAANTGSWNLLNDAGDLSGISGTEIQFAFIFKILGATCIPARLLGLSLTYEDNVSTDSHYTPSVSNSSIANRHFAYRQSTSWGSNIPDLKIDLYNVSTGILVLSDDTINESNGTFEYSDDNGATWNAWLNTADLVGNHIRYNATSLPGGVKIRAVLTQL